MMFPFTDFIGSQFNLVKVAQIFNHISQKGARDAVNFEIFEHCRIGIHIAN